MICLTCYSFKWKSPRIIDVPEPRRYHYSIEGYRPISLLKTINKVHETLLLAGTNDHLDEHQDYQILPPEEDILHHCEWFWFLCEAHGIWRRAGIRSRSCAIHDLHQGHYRAEGLLSVQCNLRIRHPKIVTRPAQAHLAKIEEFLST
ncbi:hypothetical protein Trydic_g8301 [Trypoxylus dichotomus]